MSSASYVVHPSNVHSVSEFDDDSNDDITVVQLLNYTDQVGRQVEGGIFYLPSDALRDYEALDWVLSVKHTTEDSTFDEFNDLMIEHYDQKAATGGISYFTRLRLGSDAGSQNDPAGIVNKQLASGEADKHIQGLIDRFGKERLDQMSPQQFYQEYRAQVGK